MACCLPSGTNRAVPYMLYNMCLESEKASLANKHLTPMPTPDRHLTPMPSPERATCRSNLTQERRIVASGLLGARRHVSLHVFLVCHAVCQDATLCLHVTDRMWKVHKYREGQWAQGRWGQAERGATRNGKASREDGMRQESIKQIHPW